MTSRYCASRSPRGLPAAALVIASCAFGACVGDDPTRANAVDAGADAAGPELINGTPGDGGSDQQSDAGPPAAIGALTWASAAPASVTVATNDVAIDEGGNVVAVGFYASNAPLDFGNGKAVPASTAGAGFVTKFDPTGTCVWAVQIVAPGGGIYPNVRAVAIDPTSGDVVFAADAPAAIAIGTGTSKGGLGGTDIAVGKLTSGGIEKYLKVYGGADTDSAADIAIDGTGRVVFTGYITRSGATDIAFDAINTNAPQLSSRQGIAVSLDTSGRAQWLRLFAPSPGAGYSDAKAVALDGDGNVLVGGEFKTRVQLGYNDSYSTVLPLTTAGANAGFMTKLNGKTGTAIWATGVEGNASIRAIATDPSREVVAAFTYNASFPFGGRSIAAFGGQDIAYVRLGSAGNIFAVLEFGTSGDDSVSAIAADSWGEVVVAGTEPSTLNFGLPATSHGQADGFLVKFDSGGSALWAYGIGGTSADAILAAAVNSSGHIAFGGTLGGSGTVISKPITVTGAAAGGALVGIVGP